MTATAVRPPDGTIHVERIPIANLVSFAKAAQADPRFRRVLPIPEHQAVAHTHNPYADPDDVGLIVAYRGNECAGYMGVIPALLRYRGSLRKVYWGTSYFVAESARMSGVGLLVAKNLLALPRSVFGIGPSKPSEALWRALGHMDTVPTVEYWALELARSPAVRSGNSAAQAVHAAIECQLSPILDTVSVESIDRISSFPATADDDVREDRFHRGVEWMNWKLAYPWVREAHDTPPASYANFHFKGVRNAFRMFAVAVRPIESAEPRGFILFSYSRRDTSILKVLDCRLCEGTDPRVPFALALRFAADCEADRILCGAEICEAFREEPALAPLFVRHAQRYMGRPDADTADLSRLRMTYCDGELSFL